MICFSYISSIHHDTKIEKYISKLRRLCRNDKNDFYIELLSLFGNAIVLQDQKIIFVNG